MRDLIRTARAAKGQKAHIDGSPLYRLIDHLVHAGWVERQSDLNDRRRTVLSLTMEGRRMANAVHHAQAPVLRWMNALFVEDDLNVISTALSKIVNERQC